MWRDPRGAVLLTLGFVIAVVISPLGGWHWAAIEGLALISAILVTRVPIRLLLIRWMSIILIVGLLAVLIAMGHPRRDDLGMWGVALAILIKNLLAVGAMLTLAEAVPFPRLLWALDRLGMPAVLTATLHFMYRYMHVLTEELQRMLQARRARTFRRSSQIDWGRLGSLIGMLFVRSLERGERAHAAMLARGWDGTLRTLDQDDA